MLRSAEEGLKEGRTVYETCMTAPPLSKGTNNLSVWTDAAKKTKKQEALRKRCVLGRKGFYEQLTRLQKKDFASLMFSCEPRQR